MMKNYIQSVLIGLGVALAVSFVSCNKDNSTDDPGQIHHHVLRQRRRKR